jgi:hypothetical protein
LNGSSRQATLCTDVCDAGTKALTVSPHSIDGQERWGIELPPEA